ncbi:class I SAM-dependent methyltransferase [Candidatus Pacearchaeota archaeon]|nr:class I SAM-dependent methyltransferase [Candidatus Pacearchaeota archaeon]
MVYDYENYWENSIEGRKAYYDNLYGLVKKFYNFGKGKEVLDVAGGSGQLSDYFGLKNVTLIDVSDSGLKLARNKFGFKTIKCDLMRDSWPTRDGNYDFVICNEFLEHIHFPSIVLSEINKSLKKNGILYLGQPNMTPDGEHHVRRINYSYLKCILEENGFEIVDNIIAPKIISARFSDIRKDISFVTKLKLFIGASLGLFLSKKMQFLIAKMFPNFLGGFYHIKAKKIN